MQYVLNEIKSARQFVEARRKHGHDVDMSQILVSFSTKVTKLINQTSLSSTEIGVVMSELEQSPYTSEQTAAIIAKLDEKLINSLGSDDAPGSHASGSGKSPSTVGGAKSSIIAWWNYFSQDEWDAMKSDDRSFYQKAELAVHKSSSFGCVDPDEKGVKWLLALLLKLHYNNEQPDALVRFRKFNELKTLFVSEAQVRKSRGVPASLLQYPKNTDDCPAFVKEALSGAVNRDNDSDCVGLSKVCSSIPMRKTSALLKGFSNEATEEACCGIRPSPSKSKLEPTKAEAKREPTTITSKAEPVPSIADVPDVNYCPSCGHNLHYHGHVKHEKHDCGGIDAATCARASSKARTR